MNQRFDLTSKILFKLEDYWTEFNDNYYTKMQALDRSSCNDRVSDCGTLLEVEEDLWNEKHFRLKDSDYQRSFTTVYSVNVLDKVRNKVTGEYMNYSDEKFGFQIVVDQSFDSIKYNWIN